MSASFPFCWRKSAILAAVKRCRSATVRQSIQEQSLKRHWCLCPRRSDKMPWFLHRVHLGLRFDVFWSFKSAGLSWPSSFISCWCIFRLCRLPRTLQARTSALVLRQLTLKSMISRGLNFSNTQRSCLRDILASLYCSKVFAPQRCIIVWKGNKNCNENRVNDIFTSNLSAYNA